MKRPKNESVSNQGCGIFFLMVLSMFFILSIPVVIVATNVFSFYSEKQILSTSDSPDGNHHIEVSTTGPSTRILIEEDKTSSELIADIIKGGLADIHSNDIEIHWLKDTIAEIMVEGRRDTFHYFLFDANAEEEKIKQIFQ